MHVTGAKISAQVALPVGRYTHSLPMQTRSSKPFVVVSAVPAVGERAGEGLQS